VIRVDEVEVGAGGKPLHERVLFDGFDLVPADLRHARPASGNLTTRPRKSSLALVNAEFVTFVEHQLQADAQSEQRFIELGRFKHKPALKGRTAGSDRLGKEEKSQTKTIAGKRPEVLESETWT